MRKVLIWCLFIFTLHSPGADAQEYKTGIGVRAGVYNTGISLKHFIADRNAVEGILGFYNRGFIITVLYEIQNNTAFGVNHLDWFYGFGGHVGFWGKDRYPYGDKVGANTVLGVNGIIGLEYTFTEVPVNIGVDFKPFLNLIDDTGLYGDVGLSIRFAIK